MKLYIRYMVSYRCKLHVEAVLQQLDLHAVKVDLGEVEILEDLPSEKRNQLNNELRKVSLELMDDQKSILIEKIKIAIIHIIHYSTGPLVENFSEYLSKRLNYDYTYLANLFSDVTGTTIERCIISHRIEKVKELIIYDELSLTEISEKLNYSSVGHLSTQFKKVTGLTPTFFKQLRHKKRIPLEEVCNEKCND